MIRQRRIDIKEFDAFPKTEEDCKKKTALGGTFSLASLCIILYLIYSETVCFLDRKLVFKFEPDVDYDSRLQINIDLTVAMPCSQIGADVVDSTHQNLVIFKTMHQRDTWWDLSPSQRRHFEDMRRSNADVREKYHAIHELLWKENYFSSHGDEPERDDVPGYPADACQIYGDVNVSKVAGNFHITYGKTVNLPGVHLHLAFSTEDAYNFSHRIHRFSFGDLSPGIVHPLEGEEKISDDSAMIFQYFIEVVATDVNISTHNSKTYQYSVKDYQRPIDHNKGSHGVPGIHFKYDTSPVKIIVTEEYESTIRFLVKLCAVVGCTFVTNGLINNSVQFLWNLLLCNKKPLNAEVNQI